MASLTDLARNKVLDAILRDQALGVPDSWFVSLYTVMPTASTAGTEVTGTDYAPVEVTTALTAFSGTQGAGTTSASSGSSGESSNNDDIDFGAAGTGGWGAIVGWGLKSSSGAGLWLFDNLRDGDGLAVSFSANAGTPVKFTAGSMRIRVS